MQSRLTTVIFSIHVSSLSCALSFEFPCWQLAAKGNTMQIARLIKAGVDINTSDYDARSPLHLAASTGQTEVVTLLLANSANVDALDRNNRTPLDDAISGQHTAIIELLTAAGGTSDASDNHPRSSYRKVEHAGGMSTELTSII